MVTGVAALAGALTVLGLWLLLLAAHGADDPAGRNRRRVTEADPQYSDFRTVLTSSDTRRSAYPT
jgi:hypothetical protein